MYISKPSEQPAKCITVCYGNKREESNCCDSARSVHSKRQEGRIDKEESFYESLNLGSKKREPQQKEIMRKRKLNLRGWMNERNLKLLCLNMSIGLFLSILLCRNHMLLLA
jgi:hypothetical protein